MWPSIAAALPRNETGRVPRPPRGADWKARARPGHTEGAMKTISPDTKKQKILEVGRELGVERFTPAEIEQIRRQIEDTSPRDFVSRSGAEQSDGSVIRKALDHDVPLLTAVTRGRVGDERKAGFAVG